MLLDVLGQPINLVECRWYVTKLDLTLDDSTAVLFNMLMLILPEKGPRFLVIGQSALVKQRNVRPQLLCLFV